MIKICDDKNGAAKVEIKGTPIEIQAELRCLGKSMLDGKEASEDAYVVGVISPLCEKYPEEEVIKKVTTVINAVKMANKQTNGLESIFALLDKLLGE